MQAALSPLRQASLICLLLGFSTLSQAQEGGPEIYTCINTSGTVKRMVGPSLTAQEVAQTEAKAKARQLEQSHQEEDRKRDRALLTRYPNEAVHHKQRQEALAQIDLVKQAADLRVDQLKADLTKLQDELAFYAKDPKKAPTRLRLQIES